MRKTLVLLLVFTAFPTLAAFAQETKETPRDAMPMTPPQALSDDFFTWMIGEWEGWTTSPMGKSQDWQKIEWGLDKQFAVLHLTSKTTEMNEEFMKSMMDGTKMSKEDMDKMKNMTYKGMGMMTLDPKTNEFSGYWFDNWRGTYKGAGKREGNKVMTTWEGPMGTETRTIERVSEDKMVMTFKAPGPGGKEMEGRTELTRKKTGSKS